MYSDFTLMAGGQPRLTQKERFRQRFMHKLVYFPANNDGDLRLRRLRALPLQVPDLDEYRQGRKIAGRRSVI